MAAIVLRSQKELCQNCDGTAGCRHYVRNVDPVVSESMKGIYDGRVRDSGSASYLFEEEGSGR